MTPQDIGKQYDKIAQWWDNYHKNSEYGLPQLERALAMAPSHGNALDIGCGSGGRLLHSLEKHGFKVTGLDASAEMIRLAQKNHPASQFAYANIQLWESDETFDFILAWDCLFHLPLKMQKLVLSKLCRMLSDGGVMIHSFGNDVGEHTDIWKEQEFYYSSIGITANIDILHKHALSLLHLELDQFPEKHAYIISKKG